MTNLKTVLLVAGVSLFAATAAQAQQAPEANDAPDEMMQDADYGRGDGQRGGRHHGREGRGGRGGHRMQMIDVNGDGVIGDDEAASLAERMFVRFDRDGDGNITETEFTTPPRRGWHAWFGSEESEAVIKVRKDKFAALDTNKNTGVDKVEFLADAKAKLASADTDKDGKVTPWEFRALR